jgi:osmotically-inducible protein OsmY
MVIVMMIAEAQASLATLRPADVDLLADVEAALWSNPSIRTLERASLSVDVREGEVFLAGHVASSMLRRRIGDLVAAVPGVVAVHNDIVADADLATAVAQALASDSRTRSHLIRVGTFHGWVRLSGEAPEAVAQAAEEVASRVPHVRGVLDLPRAADDRRTREKRPSLQPGLGADVYTADGPAGRVSQAVISPRNRLVSHIAVQARLEVKGRTVQGQFVVPAEAIEVVSAGGVFLKETSESLAARPMFKEDDFPPAPADWMPPFPYARGTVRWPREAG